jgi:putative serine protease PepD
MTDVRRSPLVRTGAVAFAAALAGGGMVLGIDRIGGDGGSATAAAPAAAAPAASTVPASSTASTARQIYAEREAGIVVITATIGGGSDPYSPGGPGGGSQTAQGSGVVVDTRGDILTNQHVVSGATSVRVSFANGRTATAKVVGQDPSSDLAVVRVSVPAGTLHPVPLGSSSSLRVGDWVMAIGNPFGYDRSASEGIVSGLNRRIESPNGFTITGAIQTDAAVNHGNSGGALLDAQGRLVGIPAQIADSGVDANVGVAFAVPIDTAKQELAKLTAGDQVAHAWLGVATLDASAQTASNGGSGTSSGALVTGVVSGSPAARAGIKAGSTQATIDGAPACVGGDTITAVDGTPIADGAALQTAIAARSSGDHVTLTVVHADGSRADVSVTLGDQPASAPDATPGC